ncbi:hypothetical protein DER44DRAFT_823588 [Fusarium oxysporum]|nr:hypothetical protein DER44DRAFT_823588 [Fusarium oxysporum]
MVLREEETSKFGVGLLQHRGILRYPSRHLSRFLHTNLVEGFFRPVPDEGLDFDDSTGSVLDPQQAIHTCLVHLGCRGLDHEGLSIDGPRPLGIIAVKREGVEEQNQSERGECCGSSRLIDRLGEKNANWQLKALLRQHLPNPSRYDRVPDPQKPHAMCYLADEAQLVDGKLLTSELTALLVVAADTALKAAWQKQKIIPVRDGI